MPRDWCPVATVSNDRNHSGPRRSASATPTSCSPSTATQAPPGSVRCRWATRWRPRATRSGLRSGIGLPS